jgi:hypothetical protein
VIAPPAAAVPHVAATGGKQAGQTRGLGTAVSAGAVSVRVPGAGGPRRGGACGGRRFAAWPARIAIRGVEEALGTLARVAGLGPTNDAAERALRPAVRRRQRGFGKHREAGCQDVSRLRSVVPARQRPGRSVRESRPQALEAPRHGLPLPKLFPAT